MFSVSLGSFKEVKKRPFMRIETHFSIFGAGAVSRSLALCLFSASQFKLFAFLASSKCLKNKNVQYSHCRPMPNYISILCFFCRILFYKHSDDAAKEVEKFKLQRNKHNTELRGTAPGPNIQKYVSVSIIGHFWTFIHIEPACPYLQQITRLPAHCGTQHEKNNDYSPLC